METFQGIQISFPDWLREHVAHDDWAGEQITRAVTSTLPENMRAYAYNPHLPEIVGVCAFLVDVPQDIQGPADENIMGHLSDPDSSLNQWMNRPRNWVRDLLRDEAGALAVHEMLIVLGGRIMHWRRSVEQFLEAGRELTTVSKEERDARFGACQGLMVEREKIECTHHLFRVTINEDSPFKSMLDANEGALRDADVAGRGLMGEPDFRTLLTMNSYLRRRLDVDPTAWWAGGTPIGELTYDLDG